jgi:hypothetical protein
MNLFYFLLYKKHVKIAVTKDMNINYEELKIWHLQKMDHMEVHVLHCIANLNRRAF